MIVVSRQVCFSLAFVLAPVLLLPCSVPVFRYALEHWEPEPYLVVVYHDENWGDEQTQLLAWVEDARQAGANFELRLVDLTGEVSPRDQARWDRLEDKSAPRMLVQLPNSASVRLGAVAAPVGSAPFNRKQLESLVHSPLRTELADRLTAGEVVWVFLESGNSDEDDERFKVLTEQLAHLQQTLKLPEIKEEDLASLSTAPEKLTIRFSAIRVARNDPREAWFVATLLSVEPDLRDEDVIDQAMIFPVFGRGRALYTLVGRGITADTIHRAAVFLTGACQCTVKAENPGVDLLVSKRWEDYVERTAPEEVEFALIGLGGGSPSSAIAPATSPAENPSTRPTEVDRASPAAANTITRADSDEEPGPIILLPLLVLGGLGIVAAVAGIFLMLRQQGVH